ncbi:MAG: HAD family hydrolase, partial [Dehalococcoidia bacterium]|nr:HAD family hydrolase [Dehalococcoidia bacterium]
MSVTVFLDKDGTLLEDIPYNVDPQRMRLAPLGDRALRLLAEYDCRVVVVSNQSGVARGYFSESSLERVEDWLRTVFRRFGVDFAGFYYCPHHPEGDVAEFAIECDCRKPGDGMLRRAAADLGIDLSEAWMVGDILDDVEAGNRAGCRTILIDNDNETEWRLSTLRWPT